MREHIVNIIEYGWQLLFFYFQDVREHIDDVRDRENEIGGVQAFFTPQIIINPFCKIFTIWWPGDYDLGSDSDEGFDVNNSTHTTKVI